MPELPEVEHFRQLLLPLVVSTSSSSSKVPILLPTLQLTKVDTTVYTGRKRLDISNEQIHDIATNYYCHDVVRKGKQLCIILKKNYDNENTSNNSSNIINTKPKRKKQKVSSSASSTNVDNKKNHDTNENENDTNNDNYNTCYLYLHMGMTGCIRVPGKEMNWGDKKKEDESSTSASPTKTNTKNTKLSKSKTNKIKSETMVEILQSEMILSSETTAQTVVVATAGTSTIVSPSPDKIPSIAVSMNNDSILNDSNVDEQQQGQEKKTIKRGNRKGGKKKSDDDDDEIPAMTIRKRKPNKYVQQQQDDDDEVLADVTTSSTSTSTSTSTRKKDTDTTSWPPKYTVLLLQSNTSIVAFTDPRKFGSCSVQFLTTTTNDDDTADVDEIKKDNNNMNNNDPFHTIGLAPDAYLVDIVKDNDIVHTTIVPKIYNQSLGIKSILLDQKRALCGIGNWVADEVLYQCNIHPDQKYLSMNETLAVIQSVHTICTIAVQCLTLYNTHYPDTWLFSYRWNKGKAKSYDNNNQLITYITSGGRTSAIIPSKQKLYSRSKETAGTTTGTTNSPDCNNNSTSASTTSSSRRNSTKSNVATTTKLQSASSSSAIATTSTTANIRKTAKTKRDSIKADDYEKNRNKNNTQNIDSSNKNGGATSEDVVPTTETIKNTRTTSTRNAKKIQKAVEVVPVVPSRISRKRKTIHDDDKNNATGLVTINGKKNSRNTSNSTTTKRTKQTSSNNDKKQKVMVNEPKAIQQLVVLPVTPTTNTTTRITRSRKTSI